MADGIQVKGIFPVDFYVKIPLEDQLGTKAKKLLIVLYNVLHGIKMRLMKTTGDNHKKSTQDRC